MLAQVAFYAALTAAGFLPAGLARWKPLRLTTMFTGMNAALLVGLLPVGLRGSQGEHGGARPALPRRVEGAGDPDFDPRVTAGLGAAVAGSGWPAGSSAAAAWTAG